MKKTAQLLNGQQADRIESELAELGEECARVLLLLQRLAKARAEGHDVSDVLGEIRLDHHGRHQLVIIPKRRELPRGTLKAILEQAGLTTEEFVALL